MMMKKIGILNDRRFFSLFLSGILFFTAGNLFLTGQEDDWDEGTEEKEEKKTAEKEKEEKKEDKKEKRKGKEKIGKKEKKTKLDAKGGTKKDKKDKNKSKKKRSNKDWRPVAGKKDEYEFKGKTLKIADFVKDMMVKVPAGEFLMGSPADEKGRKKDERQHKVKISQDFYISKYEVTQDLFLAVMGRRAYLPMHRGKSRPMENITWDQALAFCRELNKLDIAPEGYFFFLPTEAQWEYAAKGGAKGGNTLYAGSNNIGDVAIYSGNGENYVSDSNEVGGKKPNSLGLFDMSGSVAEWCFDWYAPYRSGKTPLSDPWGPRQNKRIPYTRKVLRGGHWNTPAADCRVAARTAAPKGVGMKCGIRVVLVKPPAKKAPAPAKAPAKEKQEEE
ncbi:MAG: SUMF1/EgtB/PvdO family nonheme iron enzyme [Lentisphaeria bacterium]|nr:SUMF1/EgtB/PvdO family nonheme iron enzyme [Lentisphaeria bacterium]